MIYMDRVENTVLSPSRYKAEQTKYTGIVHDLPTTRHTHTMYTDPQFYPEKLTHRNVKIFAQSIFKKKG
jgi:hypothetical protein